MRACVCSEHGPGVITQPVGPNVRSIYQQDPAIMVSVLYHVELIYSTRHTRRGISFKHHQHAFVVRSVCVCVYVNESGDLYEIFNRTYQFNSCYVFRA